MKIWSSLHPRRFFETWNAIDDAAAAEREQSTAVAGTARRRATIALLTAAVCLLILHYLKFSTSFRVFLGWFDEAVYRQLQHGAFLPLLNYAWWGFWHIVCYLLIPLLVIKFLMRERLSDFGLRLTGLRSHWRWYALLCAPILCFVVIASFREDFLRQYPFYKSASRSGFDLFAWELIYLSQFVVLEFFFRGFLLYSCRIAFGANAVLVMCLPYLMIHFAKPWPEAAGAVLFGLFLGMLALRSGSIWGGVLVHMTIASSMDFLALLRTVGLPDRWWP